MAVVSLGNVVKYNQTYYPAHTAIEIDDEDLASFVKLGATILSQNEKIADEEVKKDTVVKEVKKTTRRKAPSK